MSTAPCLTTADTVTSGGQSETSHDVANKTVPKLNKHKGISEQRTESQSEKDQMRSKNPSEALKLLG